MPTPPKPEVADALDRLKDVIRSLSAVAKPMSAPEDPMLCDPFSDMTDMPGLDAMKEFEPLFSPDQEKAICDKIDVAKTDDEVAAEIFAWLLVTGSALAKVAM